MNSILVVRNLQTYFYTYRGVVKALNGVSFEVRENEIFGLVGETGCGKSVTALSILQVIQEPGKIISGDILFDNENLMDKTKAEMQQIRGRQIAMIFQDPTTALNPVFSIGNQLTETIRIHQDVNKQVSYTNALNMLNLVRIPAAKERIKEYPHEFSGGMQQRAMIAISLSCRPKLLIADEPTTNLDVTIQAQILRLIKRLRTDIGMTVLLITHDLGVIAEMCDRVGVMYCGEIIELAKIEDLFQNPKHPYTQGLLASIPKITEKVEFLEIIPGSVPNLINPPTGCKFHPRCKYAMPICSRVPPKHFDIEPDHTAACYLLTKEGN